MRRIELKRAKRYMDMKSGKMFVPNKIYTVGDQLGARLLEEADARDDPYFRDRGEISKAQVKKMLADQEKRKVAEEKAKCEAEEADKESIILDDDVVNDAVAEGSDAQAEEESLEV